MNEAGSVSDAFGSAVAGGGAGADCVASTAEEVSTSGIGGEEEYE